MLGNREVDSVDVGRRSGEGGGEGEREGRVKMIKSDLYICHLPKINIVTMYCKFILIIKNKNLKKY